MRRSIETVNGKACSNYSKCLDEIDTSNGDKAIVGSMSGVENMVEKNMGCGERQVQRASFYTLHYSRVRHAQMQIESPSDRGRH